MYFKRLYMHGFKSFAEPVSLEFMGGMTCIVGPNGSGKSNIADAIKWVLGEQSPKTLRGGKMEEVIFAGTENRKARGIAEVTLVIDNMDGLLPIEFNEVAITRKMYRSGESEYLINNRPCRLKDIKELIMDTGMGVEGYSMIGQGKIADIVNNKADGRRELFEEAAGIVKYRVRKQDAEKKLSNASGNLDRVNDIINEIESRIDGLKNDSEKAQEYIVLRDRFRTLEINLAIRQMNTIEERIATLNEELNILKQEADEAAAEKDRLLEEYKDAKEKSLKLETSLEEIRNRLMNELESINSCKNNIELAAEKLQSVDKDANRLADEIQRDKGRIEAGKREQEEFQRRILKTEAEAQQKSKTIERLEEEYTQTSSDVAIKWKDIEKKKSAVFELHSGISVGKTEILGLKSLIDGLLKRKSKIAADVDDAGFAIKELILQREAAVRQLETMSADREKYNEILTKLQKDRIETETEGKQLSADKSILSDRIHKAITKRDLLIGFENSYEGFAYAVKFVMGNRGRLKGILGVTADLIDVPAGYETAIQTALGGGLQNIVCEDDRSASACIKLLKDERAGRATFLPVNSIKGGRNAATGGDAARLRTENGFLGFATEIIEFEAKYSKIMEYLLGRTVIADTLENAVSLSKKYSSGIRFVTLEGDDINPSGAITGGRVKNSGPNMFERKNEIKSLEEQIATLKDQLSKLEISLAEKRQAMEDVLSRIRENQEKIREAETGMAACRNTIDMTGSRENIISENISRWDKEKNQIHKEIEETEKMIGDIQGDLNIKQSQIAENEGFVDDQTKVYETAKAQADSVMDEIGQLRIALSALESDKRHDNEGMKKGAEEIQTLEQELKEKDRQLQELRVVREKTALEAEQGRKNLEDLKCNYDRINLQADGIKKEKDELALRINEAESLQKELESRISNAQTRNYEIGLKIAKSETQSESIIERLWDSFDVTLVEARSMCSEDFAIGAATRESREIKGRMAELEPVNIGAIEEYKQVAQRYEFMTEQKEDLNNAIESLKKIIVDMDKKINARFIKSFEEISVEFKKTFEELFGGGTAELKLENSENVLESVIEIVARPPGKKLQNINLLSGGEKTLTAIALLCAILKVKPAPFCILDEAEAALDDLNIGRFVEYLKGFTDVQFIVVTHQKVTMEKSDVMYGITMPEKGVSKVVSLKMNQKIN